MAQGLRDVIANTRCLNDSPSNKCAWRDLQEPNQKVVFEGRTFETTLTFTAETGWVGRKNKGTQALTAEQLKPIVDFWPKDFYTMIRRLAAADQGLCLTFVAPRRVEVNSKAGDEMGWWEIDATGQPIRWGTIDGGEALEYVYGPVQSFGNINFPAWRGNRRFLALCLQQG